MKYILMKFLIILFSTLLISSCASGTKKFLPSMVDKELRDETDKTTEEYRVGWKDGCEVGISGASNTFYKMFYRNNKIDGYRMSSSPEYRDAWDSAFWYCFRSTYIRQKSSLWSSIMKGFR
jgi:hypothetical protein